MGRKAKVESSLYFRALSGHCDCGSELGSAAREPVPEPGSGDTEMARLRAKGWSEGKIRRWMEDKERAGRKAARARSLGPRHGQGAAPARQWADMLRGLASVKGMESFGILLHFYRGNQAIEDFEIRDRVRIPAGDLDEGRLKALVMDTLYVIPISR